MKYLGYEIMRYHSKQHSVEIFFDRPQDAKDFIDKCIKRNWLEKECKK